VTTLVQADQTFSSRTPLLGCSDILRFHLEPKNFKGSIFLRAMYFYAVEILPPLKQWSSGDCFWLQEGWGQNERKHISRS